MSFSRKQSSREGLRLTGEVRGPVLEPQATLAPSLLTTEVTGTGIMEETTTTTRGGPEGSLVEVRPRKPSMILTVRMSLLPPPRTRGSPQGQEQFQER